jgi:hypothetical protein
MQRKRTSLLLIMGGVILLLGSGVWLYTATPAKAQCGSQASSCKNCHEVQAQDPVNNDGTAWHTSHAFGDFCYICHAGNQQATDKDTSHQGMEAPMSDVKASCQQCHAADLDARAQVYATTLGVTLGGSGGEATPVPEKETPAAAVQPPASSPAAPASAEINYDDPNLVDYAARYNQIALGQKPVNWGNVILIVMIVLLAVGGSLFVIYNEKLVKVSFGETKAVAAEYPADVVDMLPSLSRLKASTRQSIKKMLDNPAKTDKVFGLIDEILTDKKDEEKNHEIDH